jgi:tRNA pseudouridine32 synthase/23S rRNA pseudouridine746 synthase
MVWALGDPVYGTGQGPMLLHSRFLSIPRTGKAPAEATAPLPATFTAAGFGPEYLDDAGL